MDKPSPEISKDHELSFADRAEQAQTGIIREFFDFLKTNKKWWLAPIIVVLLVVSLMVILGSSVAAPFIYTLF